MPKDQGFAVILDGDVAIEVSWTGTPPAPGGLYHDVVDRLRRPRDFFDVLIDAAAREHAAVMNRKALAVREAKESAKKKAARKAQRAARRRSRK